MSANRRRTIYIYKDFQRSFIFSFCLATFGAMLTTSIILVMLFTWASDVSLGHSLSLLMGINSLVLLVIVALTAIVALLASHKIGGPLYRLENAFSAIGKGDLTEEVHLREDDKLKQLAISVNQMTGRLKDRLEALELEVAEAAEAAEGGDLEQVKEKVAGIKRNLASNFVLR